MSLVGEYVPSPSQRAREQVETYESSGGTRGTTMRGMPVIILTTLGARSGKIRKTPLMRVEAAGKYAVVASMGGASTHPVWYHNLVAHPEVELQDGAEPHLYKARILDGDERADWWEHAVATWPTYASYQEKTDREIPLFLLERA